MKKKILLLAVPVAVIALLWTAHLALSYGGHRHGGGMMGEFMIFRLERMAKDLNLDASQQAKLDGLKQDIKNIMDQRMEKGKGVHATIQQELSKPNPDFSKITPLIDQQIDDRAAIAHQMNGRVGEFLQSLTPAQKKQVADHFMQHMQHMQDHDTSE